MNAVVRYLAAAVLAASSPAPANDTLVTLGAGGLVPVSTSAIVMESEDLQISRRAIVIGYVFRNITRDDVSAIVAFPLPTLNGGDLANRPMELPAPAAANFVDFQVFVGGRRIATEVQHRASHEDRDITSRLQSLGLPASVTDPSLAERLRNLPRTQLDVLVKDGLVECANRTPPWAGCLPFWETRTQFFWRQRFPAGEAVRIDHRYRPVVGGSYLTMDSDGAEPVAEYCGGPAALAAIAKEKRRLGSSNEADVVLVERQIRYILTTANNWSGPVRKFHLTILADSPDDLVLSCMPLRRTGPSRYELSRSDFRPEKDLDVLLLQRAR
jgi:hypothetical protein